MLEHMAKCITRIKNDTVKSAFTSLMDDPKSEDEIDLLKLVDTDELSLLYEGQKAIKKAIVSEGSPMIRGLGVQIQKQVQRRNNRSVA